MKFHLRCPCGRDALMESDELPANFVYILDCGHPDHNYLLSIKKEEDDYVKEKFKELADIIEDRFPTRFFENT